MDESAATPPSACDPGELLGHAVWVRRLARALVIGGDPAADGDDVAQQTWLAALRLARDPAAEKPGNPRGWLQAVARNVARRFARDHAARHRREEAAAPEEALAPADDAVARAELHGKVVAAVVALGEPYRSTLIRRYLDEQSPSQIAALDAVPVATVKTRLKRGLAMLRDRFAKELGEPRGGERDWRGALLTLFAPGAAESAALLGSTTAIALSMKWKLLAATGVALVTFATFVYWKPERRRLASAATELVGEGSNTGQGLRTAASPDPAAARERLEPAVAAAPTVDAPPAPRKVPRFEVAGVVRDPTGAPVAGAWVWFTDARAGWTRDPTAWFGAMATWSRDGDPAGFKELPCARTDRDGRFEFVSADRASWRVAAWRADIGAALSDERQFDRSGSTAAPLEITLRPLVGLRGRFVDERGEPVPQATLRVTVTGGTAPIQFNYPLPWQRRDDATFELPPMPAQKFSGYSYAFGYAPAAFEIEAGTPPRVHELDLVMQRAPGRLRVGRIVVENGTGSLAHDLLPNRQEWELDGSAGQPRARVACSIVRFRSEPPPLGTRLLHDGDRAGDVRLADGTYVVDRSLSATACHLGLVVREVVVAVAEAGPDEPAPDLLVDAALVPWQSVTGVLRVRVQGAPEPALDRAFASLWVLPVGGMTSGGLWMPIRSGDSPGEFLVDHVPAGRVGVHYTLPGVARIAGEVDVTPGRESSIDLAVRSGTASIHGFVEGRREALPRHAGSVLVYAREAGRTLLPALEAAEVVSEGFFSSDSLAPGEYALLWQRSAGSAVAIVTAAEDPQPVVLRMADGVDVRIAAHFATGERPEAMSLRIVRLDGTPEFDEIGSTGWDPGPGSERAVQLSPGRHLVQIFALGAEPAEAELDTRVSTRLDVPLSRN